MAAYLGNTWYMAAWAHEVGRELFTRTLLDRRLVLFRTENGAPAALLDRCPHRYAPLSRGRLVGDLIQCGYHGLCYDREGRCVRNPFAAAPPRSARVEHFPLIERDGVIWIWMGAAEPTPATIPDFSYLSDATRKGPRGHSSIAANYGLVMDNLMDLSHVEFLHPAFGGALLHGGKHSVRQAGNQIWSTWLTLDVGNTPSIEVWWPTHGAAIDHSFEMRWDPPSCMLLNVRATLTGAHFDAGFRFPSCHILTPESATRTHYFWHGGLPLETAQSVDELRAIFVQAFDHEDAPMLEAVQREMGEQDFWDLRPVMTPTDAAGVRVRRVLDALIAAAPLRAG